jgi:protein TonB
MDIKNFKDHNDIRGNRKVVIDNPFQAMDSVLYEDIGEAAKKRFSFITISFIASAVFHFLFILFFIFIAGKYIRHSNELSPIDVRLVSMPCYFSGSGSINNKKPNEQTEEVKTKEPVNIASVTKSKVPEPVKEKTKPKKILKDSTYKTEEPDKADKKDMEKPVSILLSKKSVSTTEKSGSATGDNTAAGNVLGVGKGKEKGPGSGVYDSENIDRPITPLVTTNPVYPMRARRLGIEGWVTIKMLVSEKGSIENVEVIEAHPADIFEKSVIESAALWRFLPPTVDGAPVKALIKRTVRFKLKDEE